MSEPKLTKSAKALLEYFRTFPAGEPITATHKELATALNCNEKTIKRAVNQLEELGEIRIESGKEEGSANTYFLNNTLELKNIIPDYHVMPNNPLMNMLCNPEKNPINAGAFDLVVANQKEKRKEMTVYTMIDYEQNELIENLTEYERQVSDAIISLWVDATQNDITPIFTVDMIFRAMPGSGDKAGPQQKGAITKTIEKFRRLHIYVDATLELRKRKVIGENETRIFDDFYLSATGCSGRIKSGGQIVRAYKINTEPINLTYCKLTNQILTIPTKFITVKKIKNGEITHEILAMTPERQSMTGYILRRIAVMKKDKEQSRTILFDTIFKDVGLTNQSRDRTMDNRKFCFQVLDYQVAVSNIKGYEKQLKGRSITGINIKL